MSTQPSRILRVLPLLAVLSVGCALDGPADEFGEATGEASAEPGGFREHVDVSFDDAESAFELVGDPETTVSPAFVGDACASHEQCIDGFCDDGVCASWFDLGAPCGGFGEQLSTTCEGEAICVYMVTALPDHAGHCAPSCAIENCGEGMHCETRTEGDVCLPD